MVKNEKDKYLAVSGIVFGHVPASIVVIFLIPSPSVESIPYIILSAILHNGYQWFLLSAYKLGDYTKVYPIARGSAPIFVSIVSLILFVCSYVSSLIFITKTGFSISDRLDM